MTKILKTNTKFHWEKVNIFYTFNPKSFSRTDPSNAFEIQ